jgi:hypothetical protein
VNFSAFLSLAAVRTRSSACDTPTRLCVRGVLCPLAFPSAPAFRSTRSSAAGAASFAGFPATMAGSDFSRPFIVGYGSSPPRRGPAGLYRYCPSGRARDLPAPGHKERAHMPGSATAPGRPGARIARPSVLPSVTQTTSAPGITFFRGSMAGLCVPLSTLRLRHRGRLRMTRGRCGSLLLHRSGLAPPTPCRYLRRTRVPSVCLLGGRPSSQQIFLW